MADAAVQQYQNIMLGGRGALAPGQLKVHAEGFLWRKVGGGKVVELARTDVGSVAWVRVPRGYQLTIRLRTGSKVKFNGFKEQDVSSLTSFLSTTMNLTPKNQDLAVSGQNWSSVVIDGNRLSFVVGRRQALVGRLQGKNDAMLQFHVDHTSSATELEWTDKYAANGGLESASVRLHSREDILLAHYVPVYVMLPLDAVSRDNKLSHPELLACNLRALRAAGVDGVMVDVWWGIVEERGPRQYDWSAYRQLLAMVADVGLKLQVVMSFHQCGGNTGDSCFIPLPSWVLAAGTECPDIFFTNRDGLRNQEYLSFGVDDEPVLCGRTAVQVYADFMESFRNQFADLLRDGVISEIEVGLGPAGELRYPSYPETHGWRFPGIGEFQCYDKFLLRQLRHAAIESGQHEWGLSGPHDAGRYNDWPHATGFFGGHSASFASDYGRFFLQWYSDVLLQHGDIILEKAADVFAGYKTKLAAKVAGVHWWYNSHNHAAELAAGYYNLRERDGYQPIARMLARHDATLIFTCAEMRNHEQYWEAQCSPEGLVRQVLHAGWREGLEVACENALPRYDDAAFSQIIANARPDGINWEGGRPARRISSFTFLRLGPDLLRERNWAEFVRFVRRMHVGLDWHPEPEQYFRPRKNLRRSRPRQTMPHHHHAQQQREQQQQQQQQREAQQQGEDRQDQSASRSRSLPVASVPLDPSSIPPPPSRGSPPPFFSSDAPGGGLGFVHMGTDNSPPSLSQSPGSGPGQPAPSPSSPGGPGDSGFPSRFESSLLSLSTIGQLLQPVRPSSNVIRDGCTTAEGSSSGAGDASAGAAVPVLSRPGTSGLCMGGAGEAVAAAPPPAGGDAGEPWEKAAAMVVGVLGLGLAIAREALGHLGQ